MEMYQTGQYGEDKTHTALQIANWLMELKQYRLEQKNRR